MRNFVNKILKALGAAVLFAALQFVAGCTPDQYQFSHGNLRVDRNEKVDSGAVNPGIPQKGRKPKQYLVYVSAVSFPEGYDWHKDNLGGPQGCRLVLFRAAATEDTAVADNENAYLVFEEILNLPAGAGEVFSADLDMHHLIEGHLITETSTSNETLIFKDGEEILRFQGREYLRGYCEMPDGGPVYTLTQNRNGQGFHFRCGSEAVTAQADGGVYDGFSEVNYNRHGGLNINRYGSISFCYTVSSKTYYLTDFGKTSEIWMPDKGISVEYYDDEVFIWDMNNHEDYLFYYYNDGTLEDCFGALPEGNEFPPGSWYLFPAEGVSLLNGCILLALTPRPPDTGPPAVWTGKELIPIPVNGFLTGVEVVEVEP